MKDVIYWRHTDADRNGTMRAGVWHLLDDTRTLCGKLVPALDLIATARTLSRENVICRTCLGVERRRSR